MYKASQEAEAGADAAASGESDEKGDDVVDADFEEVDDDKKKSA